MNLLLTLLLIKEDQKEVSLFRVGPKGLIVLIVVAIIMSSVFLFKIITYESPLKVIFESKNERVETQKDTRIDGDDVT